MFVNANSDKYVQQRFEREFETAEQEISLLDEQEKEDHSQEPAAKEERKALTFERLV